jgi:hypothetical protein
MPIYTFVCTGELRLTQSDGTEERSACTFEREVICKPDERNEQKVVCEHADCSKYQDVLVWRGVEGEQAHRPDGKYRFSAVLGNGQRVEPAHHGRPRRTDE